MLEIMANGKKVMTVTDDNRTVISDTNIANDIKDAMLDGKTPQFTLEESKE